MARHKPQDHFLQAHYVGQQKSNDDLPPSKSIHLGEFFYNLVRFHSLRTSVRGVFQTHRSLYHCGVAYSH